MCSPSHWYRHLHPIPLPSYLALCPAISLPRHPPPQNLGSSRSRYPVRCRSRIYRGSKWPIQYTSCRPIRNRLPAVPNGPASSTFRPWVGDDVTRGSEHRSCDHLRADKVQRLAVRSFQRAVHMASTRRRLMKATVSMSYVKRQNLTMRMSMRWFARLTYKFSQKLEKRWVRCHASLYVLQSRPHPFHPACHSGNGRRRL